MFMNNKKYIVINIICKLYISARFHNVNYPQQIYVAVFSNLTLTKYYTGSISIVNRRKHAQLIFSDVQRAGFSE